MSLNLHSYSCYHINKYVNIQMSIYVIDYYTFQMNLFWYSALIIQQNCQKLILNRIIDSVFYSGDIFKYV